LKRVLLLGGGHAHVHVLRELARAPLASAELLLVTPYPRQMYSGMAPGIVAGHYRAEQGAIALVPLATAARVPVVLASAVALDAAARKVQLSDGRVAEYDVLSLDTGATIDRGRIEGAREHGLFVRPIERFLQHYERLLDLAARRVLDVVVIGGGAAGFELALAIEHRLAGRGEERARVALVTGGPAPLAGYPAAVIEHGRRALARRRITVFREACARIEQGAVVLASGARLACDAPILATGADPPPLLLGSGLALDERGFVATGSTLQSSSHPEVFAVGDVATRVDAPHPRSGVHAVRAGPPLLDNLRRFVGGGELRAHRPQRHTLNLISCGERRAILTWGGLAAEGRWAWWWKDRIDRGFVGRYTVALPVGQPLADTR
jgi:pyridine nucleotide-disulfide oxidoreductase family protein